MTETVINNILVFGIFACLIQAVLTKTQVPQQFSNNYQQNSVEEPKYVSSTSSVSKEKQPIDYAKVNKFSNHVLDNFDHRYPDGSYEFRYELADGQARYERGYFIRVNKRKSLVVVGYYSYRMPDGKYITVFYNADQYGYRQNQAITRDTLPDLPRTIEVAEFREAQSENDVNDKDDVNDVDDWDMTTQTSSSNLVPKSIKRKRV